MRVRVIKLAVLVGTLQKLSALFIFHSANTEDLSKNIDTPNYRLL
jgi:hypothetical protein